MRYFYYKLLSFYFYFVLIIKHFIILSCAQGEYTVFEFHLGESKAGIRSDKFENC